MKKLSKNYIFLICFFLIFQIVTIIALFIFKDLSYRISMKDNTLDAFYWLSPKFALIQTGNIIASWSGLILAIMGSTFPKKLYENKSVFNMISFVLSINFILFAFSALITFLFEIVNFNETVILPPDVFFHSILMIIGTIVYLTFWFFIGFGLKLTIKNSLLAGIICFAEYNFELFYLFSYKPELEQYLPVGLSREFIIRNFPFWDNSSWASVNNTIAYANSSLLTVENINILLVLISLSIYIIIVYIKPFIYMKREMHNVN